MSLGGGGGGGVGLMSCVREGSLEPPYHPPHVDHARHGEGRTGRFLRGLRRMFKRRGSGQRRPPDDTSPDSKSRSTSELLDVDRHARRKEGAYSSGLSVSHDSVFTGERSGDESSDDRPAPAHGLHLPSSHRAELVAAVRRRGRGDGSDDDEDLGLPRSPPASPPTDKADKRHHAGISHSSCSDGSLLSVGSSEMDDDSSSGAHSQDHNDSYNSSEPPSGVAPLSHSAAKHKMAVRPRRTHGAPRRKKNNPIAASALPITPELNEEMIRSTTPDVSHKTTEVVTESFSSSTTTKHHVTVKEHHQQMNKELQRILDVTPGETKTKSSSLPPGLALSQLVGQSPAKLSIVESDTPRSSIKRSKSSSQGKSLRDESPKPTHVSTSESQIHSYHSEERIICRSEKFIEEFHTSEKKKPDKKENDTRSSKKEESFFSRLLLRKSGKKSKKDQTEPDGQQDSKKSKTEKVATPQYKSVDSERSTVFSQGEYVQSHQKSTDKNVYKSAGQRAFANQMHKRLDNKGAYVQEGVYKDYNVAKVSSIDYNADLKITGETNKILNMDIKTNCGRRDDFGDKLFEKPKRTSSKEAVDEIFNIQSHDRGRYPPSSVPKTLDPFSSKAFINNELASITREDTAISPTLVISEEEVPLKAPRFRGKHNDYVFHSGSMPKNIPYFNHNLSVSASASPPKSILHQSSENVKKFNRSSEHVSGYSRDRNTEPDVKRNEINQHNIHYGLIKTDPPDSFGTGLRSLGEEYVETRSSIGKSHSFRYASETTSLSSQENQMPSLPAIVGISEPLLESWEVNYRRSVNHNHDYKRVSTRNYNLLSNAETNYDSLPSTDSSYLDSLKTESHPDIERKPLYTNSILIAESHKRDSDISQIEAKIDDIISSPKPIIGAILKSSSLDSVKSTPEKPVDDRRKTISIESALSQGGKITNAITQKEISGNKQDLENFISVTHLNNDLNVVSTKSIDFPKPIKTDEPLQKNNGNLKTTVPEFLKIQLNKVDCKPVTNVVLTANITPKKIDIPPCQDNKEQEFSLNNEVKIVNHTVQQQSHVRKSEPIQILQRPADNHIDDNCHQSFENAMPVNKNTPVINRKSAIPQSPSSTPKSFFKRKAISVDLQEKTEKTRTNSLSTEGSTEKVFDNISMDQKSHSSFGSKSSIQSTDSNDAKSPDRLDEGVVYRKKPVVATKDRSDRKKDDEPELMKVFARRSLKLKDCEAETLAQEIAEANNIRDEALDDVSATRAKILKNEFNASIKSRDSDKENEDIVFRGPSEENRYVDIAARVSQFGVPHYQRSVSITSVTSVASNPKRESAPVYNRTEVNKYKKEVSDSTPEKRLRNRTFPDPSNDREDIKNIAAKNDVLPYKADTLSKRIWTQQQKKEEDKKVPFKNLSLDIKDKSQSKSESVMIEKDDEKEKDAGEKEKEKESGGGEADASPQFKGILQMRAEWERRAMQGVTK